MNSLLRALLTGVLALAVQSHCAAQATTAAVDVPELTVLDNYVGTWQLEARADGRIILTGSVTTEWVLDGRYLQRNLNLKTVDGNQSLTMRMMMTYDPESHQYRNWTFTSNGFSSDASGRWRAAAHSMTWTGAARDGQATTITSEFNSDGDEIWNILTSDSAGNTVLSIDGRCTRTPETSNP